MFASLSRRACARSDTDVQPEGPVLFLNIQNNTHTKKNNVKGHSGSTSIPNSTNRVVIVLALSTAWTTVKKKPTLLHSHSIQLLKVCLLLFPPVTVSMQRRPRGENKNPAKHHSSSSFCEMLQLTLCYSRAAEAGLGSDKMELSPQTTFLLFQKQCFNTAPSKCRKNTRRETRLCADVSVSRDLNLSGVRDILSSVKSIFY